VSDPQGLAGFLRSRRERLSPETAGISVIGQRRTPGLRREEVAQLADLSADYYTRLEQGRGGRPSALVLDSLARALQLGEHERRHMYALAEQPTRPAAPPVEQVRPPVLRILEALEPNPALVLGRSLDVLAWNAAATDAIYDWGAVPDEDRNIVWMTFRDPGYRARVKDLEMRERTVVAVLRDEAAHHPGDPLFEALIGRLSMQSCDFARLWGGHDLKECCAVSKTYVHPAEGELTFLYEGMTLGGHSHMQVMAHLPADERTEQALERLAAAGAGSAGATAARLEVDHERHAV
jgi:transcriptional regulator with XRE-family HTH domain